MDILNDSGLVFGAFAGRLRPPSFSLTVVAKGTFQLVPGGVVRLLPPDEQLPLDGDKYEQDDPARSLRYASDFAPYKPRADVLFVGTCHPAGRSGATVCRVTLEVGALKKRITVVGDRHWRHVGATPEPSDAARFTTMPLVYERSYGGADFARNPVGIGATAVRAASGDYHPLPNLVQPRRPVVSPSQASEPIGFGPIPRVWPQRAERHLGTYDDAWLRDRWPGFPSDFDFGYFNAAPEDQQIDVIEGDETLVVENVHPEIQRLETRLPALRVRCFVRGDAGVEPRVREVPLELDTLWIDGDASQLVLVWRGSVESTSRQCKDIPQALLVVEDEAVSRLPLDHYEKAFHWSRPEPTGPVRPLRREAEEAEATSPSEVDEETAEGLRQAREMLAKAGVSKDVLDRLSRINRGDQFLEVLLGELKHDPEAADRVEREARQRTKSLLVAHGYDPALLDDAPSVKELSTLTRDEVIVRARERASFEGMNLVGLDLSDLDLRGLVFAKADLSSVDLSRAKLDDADLGGAKLEKATLVHASLRGALCADVNLFQADLSEADLSKATLAGGGLRDAVLRDAKLRGADLTGATLAGADLSNAFFEGADLSRANLTRADLQRAVGTLANFASAILVDVDAREATFDRADFTGATLAGGRFDRASLKEASLYGVQGDGASFASADLFLARVSEGASFVDGVFRGAHARGATFDSATLVGATFEGADLSRAVLSGAKADGATFHRALLKQSNLGGASLRSAILTAVDLFRSSLEAADLTKADCRRSSLYGCELLDAVLSETRLDGANVQATKLARPAQ